MEERLLNHVEVMCNAANPKQDIIYGAGLEDSFFKKENIEIWNTNRLGTLSDCFAKIYSTEHDRPKDMPGITAPFVYNGGPCSVFGLHREDINLSAYSYNLDHARKFGMSYLHHTQHDSLM